MKRSNKKGKFKCRQSHDFVLHRSDSVIENETVLLVFVQKSINHIYQVGRLVLNFCGPKLNILHGHWNYSSFITGKRTFLSIILYFLYLAKTNIRKTRE